MSASAAAAMASDEASTSGSPRNPDVDNFVDEANRENHALEHAVGRCAFSGYTSPRTERARENKLAQWEFQAATQNVTPHSFEHAPHHHITLFPFPLYYTL
eukprot:TRINITY_DN29306_c0_g1_i1.p1 TRINITY_DN29306_c0_g1~~TRINITY_DN29306_c0_g1_i1.p1  ORF type:complete len:101 (+),score=3.55 TRINITY_DN29306_c0_g1_i1:37-339(+)